MVVSIHDILIGDAILFAGALLMGVIIGHLHGRRHTINTYPSATCRYCMKEHDKQQHEDLLKEYPE